MNFNQALLEKWTWRFSQECDALWRSVIDVKYGSVRGGWCSLPVVGSYGVSVWKFIRRGWDTVAKYLRWVMGLIFAFGMIYGVGIGLSSSVIQLCTLLLVLLMLGWWIICLW